MQRADVVHGWVLLFAPYNKLHSVMSFWWFCTLLRLVACSETKKKKARITNFLAATGWINSLCKLPLVTSKFSFFVFIVYLVLYTNFVDSKAK